MVKINELHDMEIPDEILPKPDFNVGEDLLIFMRNDPMFYRKTFFPAVEDFKTNKNKNILVKVIKKGLGDYCTKFNIPNPKEELMNNGDIAELISEIIRKDINQEDE